MTIVLGDILWGKCVVECKGQQWFYGNRLDINKWDTMMGYEWKMGDDTFQCHQHMAGWDPRNYILEMDTENLRCHQRWLAEKWTIEISDFPNKTSIHRGFSS